jgi:hypothetical protein
VTKSELKTESWILASKHEAIKTGTKGIKINNERNVIEKLKKK